MNLIMLASHTIDADAMPDAPVVLDAGCRGFDFTREILARWPKSRVIGMDPDIQLINPTPEKFSFVREALVGDSRMSSNYACWSTGEGNIICAVSPHYAERSYSVSCSNITSIGKFYGVRFWDLVKLDIEGSEFEVLENWPGPIAGQISVEFHDYTDRVRWSDEYYERLFAGPLKDYEVLSHELTTVGPGPAWGHWDSVLRLRK